MAFHYSFPEKVAHPAQRIHCSCGSAMRLKSRCCLLLAGSKIFLSPLLPVSILIDSLLPSKLGLPLVVLHFVILRFSLLPFSDSRDPTLISDFNGCSRFWAAHLVSSAITAGSPCGCSAAYSPSAYLTLPKHLFDFFFIYLFSFLHFDFDL